MRKAYFALALLGLSTLSAEAAGVCNRSKPASYAISKALFKKCSKVTVADLAWVQNLDFSKEFPGVPAAGHSLKTGDFEGLENLKFLRFTDQMGTSEKSPYLEDKKLPEGLLAPLTNLTHLDLNNALSEVKESDFETLKSLESLRLDNNELQTLPAGVFKNLTSLKSLYLYSNQLEVLPTGLFQRLSNLKVLELYNNKIKTLPAGIFAELNQLERLALYVNEIETIDREVFSGLTSLRSIVMDRNKFKSFPRALIANLNNLEFINLSLNDIQNFDQGLFANFENLEGVNIGGNPVGGIPTDLFVGSPKLKFIALDSTSLTCASPETFASLTELTELHLEWNPLRKECYQDLVDALGTEVVRMEPSYNHP